MWIENNNKSSIRERHTQSSTKMAYKSATKNKFNMEIEYALQIFPVPNTNNNTK